MGLLDSLFNQSTYGGQQGGLLDMLRGLQSQQSQYQPSAGFAVDANQPSPLDTAQYPSGPIGAPSSAMAQMPAGQNTIGVGGYQMPRIGDPQQFTSDPAVLPQNSQPAIGQAPQALIQAPQMLQQSSPGFGDRLMAGLQGFANGDGVLPAIANGISGLATGQRSDKVGIAQQSANMTARALLAKGIDPTTVQAAIGNPELMKTLITQTYGPEKAPTSLGSGYIYNPTTHKVERAYEPDDKIPVGFQKTDNGLQPIPGGPADPAYLRLAEAQKKDPSGNYVLGRGGEVIRNNPDGTVSVLHKNETEAQPMDPNALEVLARRETLGDFSGRKNLGRGAQGAADLKAITARSANILMNEQGMTAEQAAAHLAKKQQEYNAQGQGLNSEARTTGVREANLNLILKAADAAIPAALEASDKVARGGWVPLNKIIQGGQVMTSDPNLKKFGMANLQLAEHWARAMNPTGVLRESDRDKALSFLSTADSKETYKEAVEQLRTQIVRERDAVKATRGMSDLPGSSSPSTPKASVTVDGYKITEH